MFTLSRVDIVFTHENETRILFGSCGMDSGTREVEVRLSPVEGDSEQERKEQEVGEEKKVSLLGCHFRTIMDINIGLLALVQ